MIIVPFSNFRSDLAAKFSCFLCAPLNRWHSRWDKEAEVHLRLVSQMLQMWRQSPPKMSTRSLVFIKAFISTLRQSGGITFTCFGSTSDPRHPKEDIQGGSNLIFRLWCLIKRVVSYWKLEGRFPSCGGLKCNILSPIFWNFISRIIHFSAHFSSRWHLSFPL